MDNLREQKRINVLVGNNAKAIFDHLTEQANNPANHERRWFWELLQNAKDSKEKNLEVRLKISENIVAFSHNGDVFSEDDILHIIYYGSTKAQLEGKTGKFGTGFLTTHLLSMKVDVEGYLDNGRYFKFTLDRSATDDVELKQKLDDCYENFYASSESDAKVDLGEFRTVFHYHIDANGSNVCRKGLEDLKLIAPFVLAFNNTIQSIKIDQQNGSWAIKRISEIDDKKDFQTIKTVIGDSDHPTNFNILLLNSGDFDIAFKLTDEKTLDKLTNQIPRLFLDFPLFGSEELGIPFIINSKSFHPLKERVGIYLNTENENSPLARQNADLLKQAFTKYRDFVKNCNTENYNGLEHLLGFKRSYDYDWNDENTMNAHITSALDFLLNEKLISFRYDENTNQIFTSINDIDLPIPDKHKDFNLGEFYSLTKCLNLDSVPPEKIWKTILEYRNDWRYINNKFDDLKCDWTIRSLLEVVASFNTVPDLIKHYEFKDDSAFFDWYNKLLDLVKVSSVKDIISTISCIPDQHSIFRKYTAGQLFYDEIKDETIKDISSLSTYDIRNLLVHSNVAPRHSDFFAPFDTKELLSKLLTILYDKKKDFNNIRNSVNNPLVQLLDWAFDHNEYFQFIISKLPFIFLNSEEESTKYEPRILSVDEKVLLPAEQWPDGLQFYANIVSTKFLLSDIYNSILNQHRIEMLNDMGVIFTSPLYYEDYQFKREEVKFLTGPEDTKKMMEADKLDLGTVKLAKLAWFESGDSLSVLQRQSKKRTQLIIEFLLKHLIHLDNSWETKINLPMNPDLEVSILASLWLCRLNTNKWIYSSSGNENPDANNISIYLNEMGYHDLLKNSLVTKFLNALKLPVSDIIKKVLIKNEAEAVAWDTVYASMVQGTVGPTEVGEMLQDESVIEFYRTKKGNSSHVDRNKKIGELFENELNNLFRAGKFKDLGFKIKREPIGSDFIVGFPEDVVPEEDIFSEEYNGGAVFVLEGKDTFFLELKATNGDSVSMTRAQAQKATENPKNYCLAILKYSSIEDINADTILEKAIFIDTIGGELTGPYNRHKDIKSKVDIERSGVNVSVESEFGKVRFRINAPLWRSAKGIVEYINDFAKHRNVVG